ncbi:tyrosine--tRNA ligase, partial [Candidatus Saccharibacteria bacterium]|nr:tyrosine--tRNA ligase [Candidatus Saccharibacteria bacterium]
DYIHLGHSTNYLMLERFHQLGHKIIVLIGDFTAMIGDPSDKSSMRVQLTKEQVLKNLKTFKSQIGKILDFESTDNPIEFKFNSEWLSKLTFEDSVELASNFTVQQMLERDSFAKRISENKPLFVHEFFYPLMQGYDSVAMDVDVEIGGTDQTFNMLAGRTLLKRYKSKEKYIIASTLLVNPETGEKLMSKSLGTGVGLDLPAKEMYFKIMQLPDAGIIQCFIDCTRLSLDQIGQIELRLQSGVNPRDIKQELATEIVTMYHSAKQAEQAQAEWTSEVSQGNIAKDIRNIQLGPNESLTEVIVRVGIAGSKSEVRRLLAQGGIKVDQNKIGSDLTKLEDGSIVQVGKKHAFRIVL